MRYPSRDRDNDPPGARDGFVSSLLDQLAELQRLTDPAGGEKTAVKKDLNAFIALETAGNLVQAVAGWALDHQYGLALHGLEFVPLQPSGTKNHPEYLELRARVDSHKHEREGAAASRRQAIDPSVARALLYNLVMANPGAFPFLLQQIILEALLALDYGETLPLLRPKGKHKKRGYRELKLQLRALAFVEYRVALGQKKYEAQEIVAAAFGVDHQTIRTWEKRLREEFGRLQIERTISFAQNTASYVHASRIGQSEYARHAESAELRYGDDALKTAGQEYRAAQIRFE